MTRGWLQNVCIAAAALAIGLVGVEVVGELQGQKIVKPANDLIARDAELGYHVKRAGQVIATKTVDGRLVYRATYTIDEHFRRLTRSAADGPKVRFFGDSFTFGEGLDDRDTLPQRFADIAGANVENYGYEGYSPVQALRALQLDLYDKDLQGTKVIVLQTGPFHVERVACKPDWSRGFPRYVLTNGKLQLDGRCRPTGGQSSGIYKLLLQGFDRKITRTDVLTYIAIVDAFTEMARRKYHASVVIMDMRRGPDWLQGTGVTGAEMEDRFRKAGATVLDDEVPATDDELVLPFDGHPSALANKLYAAKLLDTVSKIDPGLLPRAQGQAGAGATRPRQAEKE